MSNLFLHLTYNMIIKNQVLYIFNFKIYKIKSLKQIRISMTVIIYLEETNKPRIYHKINKDLIIKCRNNNIKLLIKIKMFKFNNNICKCK